MKKNLFNLIILGFLALTPLHAQISASSEPFELALDISYSLLLNSIYTPTFFDAKDLTISFEPNLLSFREGQFFEGDKHFGFGLGFSLNYCFTNFLYLNTSYSGFIMNSNFRSDYAEIDGYHFFNTLHFGIAFDILALSDRIVSKHVDEENFGARLLSNFNMPIMLGVIGTLYSTEYDEAGNSFNNSIEGNGFIFGLTIAQVIAFKTQIGNVTLSFSPYFKHLILIKDASILELQVAEDDGTITQLYNSENEFFDTYKFQFGTDVIFRTQKGWSYSVGLLGLLGGILPVHGLNTYMFLASVTITYTFNKNRKAQEENNL